MSDAFIRHRKRKEELPQIPWLSDFCMTTRALAIYDLLQKYDARFSPDYKILVVQLLARVTALHRLSILGFYTHALKHLTRPELRGSATLAVFAQSAHALTPPHALTPAICKLVHEFVHPGVGSELVSAGLNAIREICCRKPWAMEDGLLCDPVAYRESAVGCYNCAAG